MDRGNRRWTEAEVIRALPVALVVLRVVAGLGVVRGLVVIEAGGGEDVFGEVVVIGVVIFVLCVGAVFQGIEKRCVLLVGEVVGGDVVGLQRNGVAQGAFPIRQRLAGDGEHEIDVHGRDARRAEDGDGFRGLFRRVLAAQRFQNMRGKRLNAERDAGHAERAEKLRLREVEGGRVRLQGDLGGFREVEGIFQRGEKVGEMLR